jgi:hypothetical protein
MDLPHVGICSADGYQCTGGCVRYTAPVVPPPALPPDVTPRSLILLARIRVFHGERHGYSMCEGALRRHLNKWYSHYGVGVIEMAVRAAEDKGLIVLVH